MSRRHETTSFLFLGPTGRPDWSLFCEPGLFQDGQRGGVAGYLEISGPGYPPNGTWATPGPKCSLLYETNMSRSGLLRPGRFPGSTDPKIFAHGIQRTPRYAMDWCIHSCCSQGRIGEGWERGKGEVGGQVLWFTG